MEVQRLLAHPADSSLSYQKATRTVAVHRSIGVRARGKPALSAACSHGRTCVARRLLEHGFDVNLTYRLHTGHMQYGEDYETRTALIDACDGVEDKPCLVQLLLERGADLFQETNAGSQALAFACKRGHEKMARLLLDRGASVDHSSSSSIGTSACTSEGCTALLQACYSGHTAVAQLLLLRNASAGQMNSDGETPLMFACGHGGNEQLVRLLLSHLQPRDVDRSTCWGRTALMCACRRVQSQEVLVKLLLDHGANVNKTYMPQTNTTALHMALHKGHEAVARMLSRHGADTSAVGPLNDSDASGPRGVWLGLGTPGKVAQTAGCSTALVDWLNAVQGFTAIHWAVESCDPKRVLAVLRKDDTTDLCALTFAGGQTALDLATSPAAFAGGPSLACKEAATLLAAAMAPWSPQHHHTWPTSFRRHAFALMCVAHRINARLREGADHQEEGGGGRILSGPGMSGSRYRWGAGPGRRQRVTLPALPAALWIAVLAVCSRGWWRRTH